MLIVAVNNVSDAIACFVQRLHITCHVSTHL